MCEWGKLGVFKHLCHTYYMQTKILTDLPYWYIGIGSKVTHNSGCFDHRDHCKHIERACSTTGTRQNQTSFYLL